MLTYFGDTDEHVVDEGFNSVSSTSLSISSEPHANTDVFALLFLVIAVNKLDFNGEMAEILGNFSTSSFNSHFPCLHDHGNYEKVS
jgi:hypothetical protein